MANYAYFGAPEGLGSHWSNLKLAKAPERRHCGLRGQLEASIWDGPDLRTGAVYLITVTNNIKYNTPSGLKKFKFRA